MKKVISIVVLLIILAGAFAAWRILGSNTNFSEKSKSIYIKTGSNFSDVMQQLTAENIIKSPETFNWVATRLGYDKNVKAGKYTIEKGEGIYGLVKKLRSGRQTPVNLVINKLRTKEDLAKKIAGNFECDSILFINFLNNADSINKYGLDSDNVMTAVIPNTYSFFWNTSASNIFKKLFEEHEKFWNDQRTQQATNLNLTPAQVYTLASIVEEETNKQEDKGKIASVYINRLETGMRLGADPTVKFALRDFGLKRIYYKHLQYPSLYNTYLHSGLPPGPICTPSSKTIDAVLQAPSTSYLYFVAKPSLDGFSNFATSYKDHLLFAKQYQSALDSIVKARKSN